MGMTRELKLTLSHVLPLGSSQSGVRRVRPGPSHLRPLDLSIRPLVHHSWLAFRFAVLPFAHIASIPVPVPTMGICLIQGPTWRRNGWSGEGGPGLVRGRLVLRPLVVLGCKPMFCLGSMDLREPCCFVWACL